MAETPDFNAFTLAFNTAQVTPAEMVAFTRQLWASLGRAAASLWPGDGRPGRSPSRSDH